MQSGRFLCGVKLILSLFLILSTGCARLYPVDPAAQPEELAQGAILEKTGQEMKRSAFLGKLADSEFVLLGENHSNVCDHKLQVDVLDMLAADGQDFAVGLEMVPVDKQWVLHKFNQGRIAVDELESALQWSDIWGHDFELYKPVFARAQAADFPLYALNLPSSALDAIRDKGLQDLGPEQEKYLPRSIIPPPKAQKDHLRQRFQAHKDMLGSDAPGIDTEQRFFLVQSIWDTKMAYEALRVSWQTGRQVLVLAGTEHVRYGWGIAYRLRAMGQEEGILTVVPWRGQQALEPEQGDVFFYCPRIYQSRLGFKLKIGRAGIIVQEVQKDTPAAEAEFRAGDTLLQAGDIMLEDLRDLHRAAVQAAHKGQDLQFKVRRADQELLLELSFD